MASRSIETDNIWSDRLPRKSWVILILMIFVMLLVITLVPELMNKAGVTTQENVYDSLFINSASFIATILAISFSISLVTIQHASTTYTPSLLDDYIKDPTTWAIFIFLSISVIFNLFAFVAKLGLLGMLISLTLTIYDLIGVAFQFYHTTKMASPTSVIDKVRRKATKFIKLLPAELEKEAKKYKESSTLIGRIVPQEMIKWWRLHYKGDFQEPLKKSVYQIADLVFKSLLRREAETASRGLSAISEISKEYLNARKEDVTPSDSFISWVFEQLKSVARITLENKDIFILKEVVGAFETIGKASTKLATLSEIQGSHQITSLTSYYLNELGFDAIKANLFDTASEVAFSLGEIGVESVRAKRDDALVVKYLSKLMGASPGWFVARRAAEGLGNVLLQEIENRVNKNIVGMHLEDVTKAANLSIKNLSHQHSRLVLLPFIAPPSRGMFPATYYMLAIQALSAKKGDFPQIETRWREEYAKEVISDIADSIEIIGSEAIAQSNDWVFGDLIDTLLEIVIECSAERFVTFEDHMSTEMKKITHIILKFYSSLSPDYLSRRSMADYMAILGIESIVNNLPSVAIDIVQNYSKVGKIMKGPSEYNREATRIAFGLEMMGIIALQNGQVELAQKCIKLLTIIDKTLPKWDILSTIGLLEDKYMKRDEERYVQINDPSRVFFKYVKKESFNKFLKFLKNAKK